MAVVEVGTLKLHFCVTRFQMYALTHPSIYSGIQFTQQRRHTTTSSWLAYPLLISLSITRMSSYRSKKVIWKLSVNSLHVCIYMRTHFKINANNIVYYNDCDNM